jgi:amphi-Trp domain-containing protein
MTDDHETEVTQDVASFVAELRRLADALESGSAYTIDLDGDLVTIPMNAMLSVAHEEDDGEVELEFQLSWSLDDEEEDEDEAADEDDDAEDPEKQSETA